MEKIVKRGRMVDLFWGLQLVWHSVIGVGHINEVKLRRATISGGIGLPWYDMSTIPVFSGHSGPLSLTIPSWFGAMSTGDGFSQCWGRNGESA